MLDELLSLPNCVIICSTYYGIVWWWEIELTMIKPESIFCTIALQLFIIKTQISLCLNLRCNNFCTNSTLLVLYTPWWNKMPKWYLNLFFGSKWSYTSYIHGQNKCCNDYINLRLMMIDLRITISDRQIQSIMLLCSWRIFLLFTETQ